MDFLTPEFSWKTRDENLQRSRQQDFDLVVIGGGINGAGVVRDAASRGLKVALFEMGDFSQGTSSRSSKLAHGGVRYLENLEFGLVHEALSERQNLLATAPNLCRSLSFMIPLFKSSRVGLFKMGAGMWLYDFLSALDTPGFHSYWSRKELKEEIPFLKSSGLKGAYSYYDGYIDDDRLVIETLRSAQRRDKEAVICNYVKVIDLILEDGNCCGVVCEDQLTGQKWPVRGRQIVSCLGPWTDLFAQNTSLCWERKLRLTKGVHLSFSREKIPIKQAVVMAVEERIIFVIPRDSYVLVGTTDTDFQGDPLKVAVNGQDRSYILTALSDYFPGLNLTESDVLGEYAGVRPLVLDGAQSEGKTSREHKIYEDSSGVMFLVGGKYTTYRKMAQDIVDRVLDGFPEARLALLGRSDTKSCLHEESSWDNYQRSQWKCKEWSVEFNMPLLDIQELVRRHGFLALSLLQRGCGKWSYWQCEAYYGVKYTMCRSLSDFCLRRSDLSLSSTRNISSAREEILEIFASELDWDSQEIDRQRQECLVF